MQGRDDDQMGMMRWKLTKEDENDEEAITDRCSQLDNCPFMKIMMFSLILVGYVSTVCRKVY